MTTPENYSRAAARLQMLSQPMGIGIAMMGDARPPQTSGRVVETIVDPGRTKRIPRTLQEAFPISEGYRKAGWHYPAPTPLADRISWGVVIALAGWLLWWAYHAPKGGV